MSNKSLREAAQQALDSLNAWHPYKALELLSEALAQPDNKGQPVAGFARDIEREATAPLIKQIKKDEALMRDVLEALTAEPEMREGACSIAIEALRERLEAKK